MSKRNQTKAIGKRNYKDIAFINTGILLKQKTKSPYIGSGKFLKNVLEKNIVRWRTSKDNTEFVSCWPFTAGRGPTLNSGCIFREIPLKRTSFLFALIISRDSGWLMIGVYIHVSSQHSYSIGHNPMQLFCRVTHSCGFSHASILLTKTALFLHPRWL